jgi:hypothetical protein
VPVLGRDVALPEIGRLENVHVGVGDHEVFEGHGRFFTNAISAVKEPMRRPT